MRTLAMATLWSSACAAVYAVTQDATKTVAVPDPAFADPRPTIKYAGKDLWLDPEIFEPAVGKRFHEGTVFMPVVIQLNVLTDEENDVRTVDDSAKPLRAFEAKVKPLLDALHAAEAKSKAEYAAADPLALPGPKLEVRAVEAGVIRLVAGRQALLDLQPALRAYENVHIFAETLGPGVYKIPWQRKAEETKRGYPPQTGRTVDGPKMPKLTKEDLEKLDRDGVIVKTFPPEKPPKAKTKGKMKTTVQTQTIHEFEVAQARVLADHDKMIQICPEGNDVGWSIQFFSPNLIACTEVFVEKLNGEKPPILTESDFGASLEFVATHRCAAKLTTIGDSAHVERLVLWDLGDVIAPGK
jgi:hypothetical protein